MDPLPRPRQAFAQQFGADVYSDFQDLCRDTVGRSDLHRVASPLPCAQAVAAMEHGKHVLVEKPLALSLEECDAVIGAAEKTGMQADRRPYPCLRSECPRDAPDHPKRRNGPARHDPELQLQRFPFPAASGR